MSRFVGRGLDKFYCYFFMIHVPISIFLDLQSLWPPHLLAKTPFPDFMKWYIGWSRDPVLIGAAGTAAEWEWLRNFLWLEGLFQLPVSIIGAWTLWHNDKRVYPLLLAYGASTATTLIPCVPAVLKSPITTMEKVGLMGTYLPYFFIPFTMTVDMAMRFSRLIAQDQAKKAR